MGVAAAIHLNNEILWGPVRLERAHHMRKLLRKYQHNEPQFAHASGCPTLPSKGGMGPVFFEAAPKFAANFYPTSMSSAVRKPQQMFNPSGSRHWELCTEEAVWYAWRWAIQHRREWVTRHHGVTEYWLGSDGPWLSPECAGVLHPDAYREGVGRVLSWVPGFSCQTLWELCCARVKLKGISVGNALLDVLEMPIEELEAETALLELSQ